MKRTCQNWQLPNSGLCEKPVSGEAVMGKDKRDKKKEKGRSLARAAGSGSRAAAPQLATYADGQPFDQVTYLEAKLILKPDRF
ncbi:MAG TPA: hypothetical protein VMH03_15380, partial [Terriglobales bacterium]|nr:hypothetical protein [Terriglobales bacterium]